MIARVDGAGLAFDALAEPGVGSALLEAIGSGRSIKAGSGTIRGVATSAFEAARGRRRSRLPAKGGSFEQSNSA